MGQENRIWIIQSSCRLKLLPLQLCLVANWFFIDFKPMICFFFCSCSHYALVTQIMVCRTVSNVLSSQCYSWNVNQLKCLKWILWIIELYRMKIKHPTNWRNPITHIRKSNAPTPPTSILLCWLWVLCIG